MKLVLATLLALTSASSYAQLYFGNGHEYDQAKLFNKVDSNYYNNILFENPEEGYRQCKEDHNLILQTIKTNYLEQMTRLISKAIALEEAKKNSRVTDGIMKNALLDKMIHYVIINEMQKELAKKDLQEIVREHLDISNKNKSKVFEMEYNNVDLDSYFTETFGLASKYIMDKGLSQAYLGRINNDVMAEMKIGIVANNTFTMFAKSVSIRVIKKGLSKFYQTAIKDSLKNVKITLTRQAFTSLGRDILIELLTMPLKGNRPSGETSWLDLLRAQPGLILNPEVMFPNGIHDNEWITHCNTINRRAYSIERVLNKLQSDLKVQLGNTLKDVDETIQAEKSIKRYQIPKAAVVDNTYVAPPRL